MAVGESRAEIEECSEGRLMTGLEEEIHMHMHTHHMMRNVDASVRTLHSHVCCNKHTRAPEHAHPCIVVCVLWSVSESMIISQHA